MILRGVGAISLAKILGLLYGALGLIVGFIFTTVSLAGLALTDAGGFEGVMAGLFGIGGVILMPVFYGAMGFVMGLITAGLFNLVAPIVGGLELRLDSTAPTSPAGRPEYPQTGYRP